MISMKTILRPLCVAALLSGGAVALSGGASAAVVCNNAGDCWHTEGRDHYDTSLGVVSHPDDWYFHQHWDASNPNHYRDYHEGRGYYKSGVWITL
jgi:hypothetical protein